MVSYLNRYHQYDYMYCKKECYDCPHVRVIKDPYGTGDSPTMIECSMELKGYDCPYYEQVLE